MFGVPEAGAIETARVEVVLIVCLGARLIAEVLLRARPVHQLHTRPLDRSERQYSNDRHNKVLSPEEVGRVIHSLVDSFNQSFDVRFTFNIHRQVGCTQNELIDH